MNHAGVLALPSFDLFIRPKISGEGVLTYLLGSALELVEFGGDSALLSLGASLPQEFLVAAFHQELGKLLERGLLFNYLPSFQDDLTAVRGRISVVNQLRRNFIHPERIACSFDEFTRDVMENRILLSALEVSRHIAVPTPRSSDSYRRIHPCFNTVTYVTPQTALGYSYSYNRHNKHYQRAHLLANAILRGERFGFQPGGTPGRSFLVNMFDLWERFVARWLERHFLSWPEVEITPQRSLLYSRGIPGNPTLEGIPDITVRARGEKPIVIDTKYKDPGQRFVDGSDVAQVIAYALCSGADRAILVYPSGERIPRLEYPVNNSAMKVEILYLWTGGTAADLEDQMKGFATGLIAA
jgi:5-methylcytosine-specific restriction enzyme subunit McrC